MRTVTIVPGEHYHIFDRGNNKQAIFLDQKDWARFLFLIIYLQSSVIFQNISRQIGHYVKNRVFNISEDQISTVLKNRSVELINFALMPNHFHLTVRELKEGGVSQYMQRVLCAYTKYFNTKNQKIGHLFQGPYKAVRIESNQQLLYLSTYIHKNPRELSDWKNKEHLYRWSSYQDYILKNRWDKLLSNDLILSQFSKQNKYDQFLKSSPAKEIREIIDDNLLID